MRKLEYRITNNNYQKKVLPIINRAESKIKNLIVLAILFGWSFMFIRKKIAGLIKEIGKELPKDLIDRELYLQGLAKSSDKMLKDYYMPSIAMFGAIFTMLKANNITKYNTPISIYKESSKQSSKVRQIIEENKEDWWADAKATPSFNIGYDYAKQIKKAIGGVDRQTMVVSEEGKKPISLWQKVELDLRHDAQLKKLDELKATNPFINVGKGKMVQLAWTSSHPDCSKRCERFQGKLMDLTSQIADNHDFSMNYKVEGHKVYCFNAIEAQVDKYGYHNNIINGFNCRHHLIPYSKGIVPVNDYTAKEIKVERAINEKLRTLERTIRHLKIEARNNKLIDLNYSKQCTLKAKQLTLEYERLCEKYGFAVQFYRLEV